MPNYDETEDRIAYAVGVTEERQEKIVASLRAKIAALESELAAARREVERVTAERDAAREHLKCESGTMHFVAPAYVAQLAERARERDECARLLADAIRERDEALAELAKKGGGR